MHAIKRPAIHDVVVVGSGAAGLMAACVAAEALGAPAVPSPVHILTDRGIGTSNSAVAQGGLHLPDDGPEALDRFRSDMERSGGDLIDPERIERFVEGVRPTVDVLRRWGLQLDLDVDGHLVRHLAGGLTEPRIVTAGDRIGTAILRVLRSRIEELGVTVQTKTQVVGIRPDRDSLRLAVEDGSHIDARSVIVAVGGGAYEHARANDLPTSNPTNHNTRLYGAIASLGVPLVDVDLYQHQPYGVVHPTAGVTEKCVPESVVELGARVVDRSGRPVAPPSADRRELTSAMFDAVDDGRGEDTPGGAAALRLTLGAVDKELLSSRYPHLARLYDDARLADGDLYVMPVVHYQLGGFAVGPGGATSIPGLFLAGEMTGGLHGRNRLMGNGITQAVVDGFQAGEAAARTTRGAPAD